MAGNQKAIKLRIKSVQSTMQICKAMELVAASRLHKAMERAENSRPYFEALQGTLAQIAAENIDMMSIYTKEPQNDDWCFIVIAGDRGFAGGYNNNLFRLVEEQMEGHEACVLPIGKKALEHFSNRKVPVVSDSFTEAGDISVADCFEIARLICHGYKEGGFGHVAIVYTNFVNMMVQEPKFIPILPLPDMKSLLPKDAPEIKKRQIIYEPNSEAVFNAIVPEYLAGLSASKCSVVMFVSRSYDSSNDSTISNAIITEKYNELIASYADNMSVKNIKNRIKMYED